MGNLPAAQHLLERVRRRLYVARFGRNCFVSLLVIAVGFACLLLTSRLTGLIPDWFAPLMVSFVPLAACVLALLRTRHSSLPEAARAIDQQARTDDLYLTLTMLEGAAGEFQPLVRRDAEALAREIEPTAVVPFFWGRPVTQGAVCLTLLLLAAFLLPSLDPFGKVAEAKERQILEQELQQNRKITQVRQSQLARSDLDAEMSETVEKLLEDLQVDLRQAKPQQGRQNDRVLAAHQKTLGERWRSNAKQLKHLLIPSPSNQRFGSSPPSSTSEWSQELQQGSSLALQQELNKLQQDLQAALKTPDPVKRTEALRNLQKKLDELSEFARNQANSKPLTAAVERAIKPLEAMKTQQSSQEAGEAVAEAMQLASMELKQLAQSIRDLKQLEQALETVQMARKLNANEKLDGEMCGECQSMADYADLYARTMSNLNDDAAGSEVAEEAYEKEPADTDFKSEKIKTSIQKGKILLSIRNKGVSVEGSEDIHRQYRAVVEDLQQSVSEAIEKEQIPPGYHDSIKRYFDRLDETDAP